MRILVPFSGFAEYYVDTDNEDIAREVVMSGEAEFIEYGPYEEDTDYNNWEVQEDV